MKKNFSVVTHCEQTFTLCCTFSSLTDVRVGLAGQLAAILTPPDVETYQQCSGRIRVYSDINPAVLHIACVICQRVTKDTKYTECRGRIESSDDSHSESPGFKSWSGDLLF
jgi:hypothetical protein